jgi:hypothetical protein
MKPESVMSEARRRHQCGAEKCWVIAFGTTGGRMVLGFYSLQPFVLVLK